VTIQPRLHRLARRAAVAGLAGAQRAWRLAYRLKSPPSAGLVEIWPHLTIAFDPTDYVSGGAYQGTYERPELRLLQSLVRPGALVLDVGANSGYYTSTLAGMVGPGGTVHAFEPSPTCLAVLEQLVDHSPLRNVTVHAVALGAESGTAPYQESVTAGNAGLGTLRPGSGSDSVPNETTRIVTVTTLDRFAEEHVAGEIDFVKIDVEGFEGEVLSGGAGLYGAGQIIHTLIEVSPQFGNAQPLAEFLETAKGSYVGFAITESSGLVRRPLLRTLSAADVAGATDQFNMLISRRDRIATLPGRNS
jgi:FkbM family methyltransferase